MDLVGQIKAILKHEGLKRKTRRVALKETIEYYHKDLRHRIQNAKEMQKKADLSEIYLQCLENEKLLFEKVLKGKTTYQKEWNKVEKDPEAGIKRREQDPEYALLERTLTLELFRGYFDEIDDQVKLVDDTIRRLYLKKPYDPALWREIL
jgi:hypothetical protein